MNKLPSLKICPYCSKTVTKLTKDHIVSRGLFIKPYPENLPTVRVCEECNHTKGGNEDYFRDFLILNMEAGTSTTARAIVNTTLRRAIQSEEHGNTSKIAEAVVSQGQYALLANPSGVIWGQAYRVPVEKERIKTVLAYMIKGFHFKKYKKILPSPHKIVIARCKPKVVPANWDSFLLGGAQRENLGQVFSYQYLSDPNQQVTLWQFLFYQSILFQLATYPPEFVLPITTSSMF